MRDALPVVRAAIGEYPHTAPLMSGALSPVSFRFAFERFPAINRAFAPMVRELRFDLSEMAIATFLQAKAYGKTLVLLPVVLAGRFQEQALICRADSGLRSAADLAGRLVGVRAYSQTTGLWLRGILEDDYGVPPDAVRWVTFEGAHVAEFADPPFVERAAAGADMMRMLHEGDVDAVIVGNDMQADARLRCVFPDPEAAGRAFYARHHVVPINHMLVATADFCARAPDVVREIVGLFAEAAQKREDGPDPRPFGRAAVKPGVALALRYATVQGLLPRAMGMDEVWAGSPDVG